MNTNGIVTGTRLVSSSISATDREVSPNKYLFDDKSVSRYSYPVMIHDGQVCKLSTFNLPDEVELVLHRVLIAGNNLPSDGCCGAFSVQQAMIQASEVFKIGCKPVVLNNCDSVLFLTVPGIYMLEVSNEDAIGNFTAIADIVDSKYLPNALIIGNIGVEGIVGVKK